MEEDPTYIKSQGSMITELELLKGIRLEENPHTLTFDFSMRTLFKGYLLFVLRGSFAFAICSRKFEIFIF